MSEDVWENARRREIAWPALLERYADGRALCNCRQAYYTEDQRCRNGCSANQYDARKETAVRVLEEFVPEALATPSDCAVKEGGE